MTTTLGTNSNNDLYLGAGNNLVVLTGLKAIIQACETASKAQLGEMVLATTSGIPNFQTIWVGSPNYSLFTDFLRKTLLGVSGVQEVTELDIKYQNNVLSYTANIKTAFGIGLLNV